MMQLLTLTTRFADACTGQGLFPDIYNGLRSGQNGGSGDPCSVNITTINDVFHLLANFISILMLVAGFVAAGFIIYGGFRYMTSGGDPSGIKSAKETVVNAVIGLVMAMIAFGVLRFLTGYFA